MAAEGFVEIEGILDVLPEGYGFIRTQRLPARRRRTSTARCRRYARFELRRGDMVTGRSVPPRTTRSTRRSCVSTPSTAWTAEEAKSRPRVQGPDADLPRRALPARARRESSSPPESSTWSRPSARDSAVSSSRRPRQARRPYSRTSPQRSARTTPRPTSCACSSTSGPRKSRTWSARSTARSSPRPSTCRARTTSR